MNLGFYVKSMSPDKLHNRYIYSVLNQAVKNDKIRDACLFYDDIDFIPFTTDFGMFNSTDVWNFTGQLVTTCLESTDHALKTVNRFKLSYLHHSQETNVLSLIMLSKKVNNILAASEEDQKNFYRVTGVKPKLLDDLTIGSFLKVLK